MKLIRVQKDTQFEGLARPMTARAFIGSDSHSHLDRCRDKCWLSRFYYNLQDAGPAKRSSSHTRDRILWVGKSPESVVRPTLGYRSLPCQNTGGHAHHTSRLSSETFVAYLYLTCVGVVKHSL